MIANRLLKIIYSVLAVFFIPAAAFAQSSNNETITISTYYPSPGGVYSTLRVFPSARPDAGSSLEAAGTMFFNIVDNMLYIFNGNTNAWENVGTGIWTVSGQDTFLSNTGNVSIGINTAAHRLEVNGTLFAASDVCLRSGKCLSQMVIIPINGTCGSSNNMITSTAPTTGLCSSGTATTVTGTGPWSWQCIGANNGTIAYCHAYVPTSACGSAAGTKTSAAPSSNLCSVGTASAVTYASFNWYWTCSNSFNSANCQSLQDMYWCGKTCYPPPPPFSPKPCKCRTDCSAAGGYLVYQGGAVFCSFGSYCPSGWCSGTTYCW